jgi:hypothetical protein
VSLLIREGASVKAVQRSLGHKSAVMTLDRYGHLGPDELEDFAERLDRARAAAVAPSARPIGAPTWFRYAKGQVIDLALWWRWGDSNSTSPSCVVRGQEPRGRLSCSFFDPLVTVSVHGCPSLPSPLRTQRGPRIGPPGGVLLVLGLGSPKPGRWLAGSSKRNTDLTPCSQSQIDRCCHLQGWGTVQVEAAS